jgi:hypothetical protein
MAGFAQFVAVHGVLAHDPMHHLLALLSSHVDAPTGMRARDAVDCCF